MKKILIVEDEKTIARPLTLKLKCSVFEAQNAYDGQEALDVLAKSKFDLIILDLVMPKVNGFEVLEKLKEQHSKTPVIVVSNLNQEEDIAKAKSLGADYFLKTEVFGQGFLATVKKTLNL